MGSHYGMCVLHGHQGHPYPGTCPTWIRGSYPCVPPWNTCPTWAVGSFLPWDVSYMDTGVVSMGPTMGRVLHGQQDHTSGSQLNTGPPWAPTPPRQGPMRTPSPSHGSHLRPGPPHLRAPPSLWVPPRPHPRVVTVLTLAHLGAHRSVPAAPPAHRDGDEGTEGPPGRQVERSPRHSTAGELGCSGDTGGTDVPVSPRRAVNVPAVSPSSPVQRGGDNGNPHLPTVGEGSIRGSPCHPIGAVGLQDPEEGGLWGVPGGCPGARVAGGCRGGAHLPIMVECCCTAASSSRSRIVHSPIAMGAGGAGPGPPPDRDPPPPRPHRAPPPLSAPRPHRRRLRPLGESRARPRALRGPEERRERAARPRDRAGGGGSGVWRQWVGGRWGHREQRGDALRVPALCAGGTGGHWGGLRASGGRTGGTAAAACRDAAAMRCGAAGKRLCFPSPSFLPPPQNTAAALRPPPSGARTRCLSPQTRPRAAAVGRGHSAGGRCLGAAAIVPTAIATTATTATSSAATRSAIAMPLRVTVLYW